VLQSAGESIDDGMLSSHSFTDLLLSCLILHPRPCHTAVHRSHDNDTLATLLYTVPALLEDEKVGKFVRWASKQRGRAQQDGHNQQLRYQR